VGVTAASVNLRVASVQSRFLWRCWCDDQAMSCRTHGPRFVVHRLTMVGQWSGAAPQADGLQQHVHVLAVLFWKSLFKSEDVGGVDRL
jgi:hypothetical protein